MKTTHSALILQCVDRRLTEAEATTMQAVRERIGGEITFLEQYRVPGVSVLLAGRRNILHKAADLSARDLFIEALIWNIQEVEACEDTVDYIVVCGHTGGCKAERGDDLMDPNLTDHHLEEAIAVLQYALESAKDQGAIDEYPTVLGMIQHLGEDSAIDSAQFIN